MSERIKTGGIIKYYKRLKKINPFIDILLFVIIFILIGTLVYLLRQQNKKDSPSEVDMGPAPGPGPQLKYDLDDFIAEIASYRSKYANDKSESNEQLLQNKINECIARYGGYACLGGEEIQKREIKAETDKLQRKMDAETARLKEAERLAKETKAELQRSLENKQGELVNRNQQIDDKKAELQRKKDELQRKKDEEAKKVENDARYNYNIIPSQRYNSCETSPSGGRGNGCLIERPRSTDDYGNNFFSDVWTKSNDAYRYYVHKRAFTTEEWCATICNRIGADDGSGRVGRGLECKGYSYKFGQHPISDARSGDPMGTCYLSWSGILGPKITNPTDEDNFWITRRKRSV